MYEIPLIDTCVHNRITREKNIQSRPHSGAETELQTSSRNDLISFTGASLSSSSAHDNYCNYRARVSIVNSDRLFRVTGEHHIAYFPMMAIDGFGWNEVLYIFSVALSIPNIFDPSLWVSYKHREFVELL